MREILFRGKHIHALTQNRHIDGTWVYGYLCSEDYINSPGLDGEFLVDPETVCQYTGLTDRDGDKVFDKDILEFTACDGCKSDHMVFWNGTEWATRGTRLECIDDCRSWDASDWKIIGNVYDDPELAN